MQPAAVAQATPGPADDNDSDRGGHIHENGDWDFNFAWWMNRFQEKDCIYDRSKRAPRPKPMKRQSPFPGNHPDYEYGFPPFCDVLEGIFPLDEVAPHEKPQQPTRPTRSKQMVEDDSLSWTDEEFAKIGNVEPWGELGSDVLAQLNKSAAVVDIFAPMAQPKVVAPVVKPVITTFKPAPRPPHPSNAEKQNEKQKEKEAEKQTETQTVKNTKSLPPPSNTAQTDSAKISTLELLDLVKAKLESSIEESNEVAANPQNADALKGVDKIEAGSDQSKDESPELTKTTIASKSHDSANNSPPSDTAQNQVMETAGGTEDEPSIPTPTPTVPLEETKPSKSEANQNITSCNDPFSGVITARKPHTHQDSSKPAQAVKEESKQQERVIAMLDVKELRKIFPPIGSARRRLTESVIPLVDVKGVNCMPILPLPLPMTTMLIEQNSPGLEEIKDPGVIDGQSASLPSSSQLQNSNTKQPHENSKRLASSTRISSFVFADINSRVLGKDGKLMPRRPNSPALGSLDPEVILSRSKSARHLKPTKEIPKMLLAIDTLQSMDNGKGDTGSELLGIALEGDLRAVFDGKEADDEERKEQDDTSAVRSQKVKSALLQVQKKRRQLRSRDGQKSANAVTIKARSQNQASEITETSDELSKAAKQVLVAEDTFISISTSSPFASSSRPHGRAKTAVQRKTEKSSSLPDIGRTNSSSPLSLSQQQSAFDILTQKPADDSGSVQRSSKRKGRPLTTGAVLGDRTSHKVTFPKLKDSSNIVRNASSALPKADISEQNSKENQKPLAVTRDQKQKEINHNSKNKRPEMSLQNSPERTTQQMEKSQYAPIRTLSPNSVFNATKGKRKEHSVKFQLPHPKKNMKQPPPRRKMEILGERNALRKDNDGGVWAKLYHPALPPRVHKIYEEMSVPVDPRQLHSALQFLDLKSFGCHKPRKMPEKTLITLKAGEKVLLIGNPLASADGLTQAHKELSAQVTATGSVSFEQLDRIPQISLASSTYNSIVTGTIPPNAFPHSDSTLVQFLKALVPGGVLHLKEPVLSDTAASDLVHPPAVQASPTLSSRIPSRTLRGLVAALRLAGFVDIAVVGASVASSGGIPVSDADISKLVRDCWALGISVKKGNVKVGVVEAVDEDAVCEQLRGRIEYAEVIAKKPAYEIGAGVKLSFGKKKAATVTAPAAAPPVAPAKKKAVWVVSADDNDDEEDLIDEEDLLDEEDKKPAVAVERPTDCGPAPNGGKKKACKNCSCGLAEIEAAEAAGESAANATGDKLNALGQPEVIVVMPKKVPASSCGNCYLGDAFRCSSCPYLGMPAFKPGEKVTLGGNLLKDDI
ncbi:Anamorsin [Phlyctochytrium planicorne]|nr:Anamorsin [Phlyctochytrium planicorne]